ncbi:MAG: hypothetical protein AB8E87_13185 [Prochlorococcus sp.]|nr:hypothetical protein [Prochlorococcaceae cyanobacterium Fu_MAG_50]
MPDSNRKLCSCLTVQLADCSAQGGRDRLWLDLDTLPMPVCITTP